MSLQGTRRATDVVRTASQQTGFWILLVLLALIAIFAVVTPPGTFFTLFNLRTLLADSSLLLIIGAGALIAIVSGGIDLSAGSMMALGGAVGYLTMHSFGDDAGWFGICVGIAAGVGAAAAWGTLNGILIAYFNIPAFVVTLGSLGAALGVARLLLRGGAFATVGPPSFQKTLGVSTVLGVPTPFLIAIVVTIVVGVALAVTRFGEHVYLTGANEEGARRAGISIRRTHLLVYVLSGTLAGIAGMVNFARFNSVDIATGHTQALIGAIAAVIIGGASLTGGVGTMVGTVVAVCIPVVLNNGLIISGAPSFWQEIVVGAILVGAVGFDQRRRSAAGGPPRGARRARRRGTRDVTRAEDELGEPQRVDQPV
jgi:ribose transport system permease protein